MFVAFLGLMTPYFFVTAWADSYFGGAPRSAPALGFPSCYLTVILNAGGTFGRIIPAHIAGCTCVQTPQNTGSKNTDEGAGARRYKRCSYARLHQH